jgi:large subunit ribosomal protein L4
MTVKVYNQDGKEVGKVELNKDIFGIEPNQDVVHQYIVNFLSRQRQGNSSTKTRKEVRGGGKKPWRQKGTGRARAGTIRSPLWRGGGTVFGPHPRDYDSKFPKQMKRLAIQSVLSEKARTEKIRVVDQFSFEQPKTKSVVNLFTKLDISGKKCLVLDEGKNQNLVLSCRNIPKVKYSRAALTNGYDLLNADIVLFTKTGLEKVQEVFA